MRTGNVYCEGFLAESVREVMNDEDLIRPRSERSESWLSSVEEV